MLQLNSGRNTNCSFVLTGTYNHVSWNADDMLAQKEKNKLLQEEMESTLQDIQNM